VLCDEPGCIAAASTSRARRPTVEVANVAREDAVKTTPQTTEAHQTALATVSNLVERMHGGTGSGR
jgi:hypothetical protein